MHHTGNGVSIRLDKPKRQMMRPSSAELRHEKLHGKVTHGPLGKNEFQEALTVMEAIYAETKTEPVAAALSACDALVHYQTKPALELLNKRTWRDFFNEMKERRQQGLDPVKSAHRLRDKRHHEYGEKLTVDEREYFRHHLHQQNFEKEFSSTGELAVLQQVEDSQSKGRPSTTRHEKGQLGLHTSSSSNRVSTGRHPQSQSSTPQDFFLCREAISLFVTIRWNEIY